MRSGSLNLIRAVLATSLSGTVGCSYAMRTPPPTAADTLLWTSRLRGLLDDQFHQLLMNRPAIAVWSGAWNPEPPDPGEGRVRAIARSARVTLQALDEFRVDALAEDDYVAWLALRWEMEFQSAWPAYYTTTTGVVLPGQSPLDEMITTLRGQSVVDSAGVIRHVQYVRDAFATVPDDRTLIVGRILDVLADHARGGVVLPAMVLPRAVRHVRSFIAPPILSPFALPTAAEFSGDRTWLEAQRMALGAFIGDTVNPALDSLARFLAGPYGTQAPETPGLSRYPGGRAHYEALLRFHSTLDISPEDAHAIGLREASTLALQAAQLAREAGLPAHRDSLREKLQSDPRWEVPLDSTGARKIQNAVVRFFSDTAERLAEEFRPEPVPSVAIGVLPVTVMTAPRSKYEPPSSKSPTAHYELNLRRIGRLSAVVLPGMVFEDLVPGLHFQQAFQRADGALPSARRVAWHDGYVRGWQAYALAVADSLSPGLDPEVRFAIRLRLLAHACGLTVDTGINAFGWTREQALEFLRAYLPWDDAALADEFIIPAVEQPGRLAAATLGAHEFTGLRLWAQRELGDRFSVRAFHREVLRLGSLPLPVLGAHLERWLWDERHRISGSPTGMPRGGSAGASRVRGL